MDTAPAQNRHHEFGRQLYRIRKEVLGIPNVEEMAKRLRCSPRTMENYEQGISLPTGEAPWLLFRLIGPEHFATLVATLPPSPVITGEVEARTNGERRSVTITGREERLRDLIRIAEELLGDQSV